MAACQRVWSAATPDTASVARHALLMENVDLAPVVAVVALVAHQAAAVPATKKLAATLACLREWSAAARDTACQDRPVPATVHADTVPVVVEAAVVQAAATTMMMTRLAFLENLPHALSTLHLSRPPRSNPSLPSMILSLPLAPNPFPLAQELVVTMETAVVAAAAVVVEATVVSLFCLACSWVLLL